MKALKTAASLMIASAIVFQGIGLQAINVLADGSDTLSIAGGKLKQNNESKAFYMDTTTNSVTYYNYSGAYKLQDQDFMSVDCSTEERTDIVALNEMGNYVFLSDSLYTFGISSKSDNSIEVSVSASVNKGTVYLGPNHWDGNYYHEQEAHSSNPVTLTISDANNAEYPGGVNISDSYADWYICDKTTLEFGRYTLDPSTRINFYEPSESEKIFYIYTYDVDNDIPVYKRINSVDEIVSESKYIIVADRGEKTYAFTPVEANVDGSYTDSFVSITDNYSHGFTKMDFTVCDDVSVADGATTTFVAGDNTYTFTAKYNTSYCFELKPDAEYDIELYTGASETLVLPGAYYTDATQDFVGYDDSIANISLSTVNNYESYVTTVGLNTIVTANNSINADECLYKFELMPNGTSYFISSVSDPSTYLSSTNVNRPNNQYPEPFSIAHEENSYKFALTGVKTTISLDASKTINGNNPLTSEVYLYQKVGGAGSAEIPGYVKVSSIEPDGEYLIVLVDKASDAGYYYVVSPTIKKGDVAPRVGAKSTISTKMTITGKDEGQMELITYDGIKLNITVKNVGEVVTPEDKFFVQGMPVNDVNEPYVSKINISAGLSYPLSVDEKIVDATKNNEMICSWTTTNPSVIDLTDVRDNGSSVFFKVDADAYAGTVTQEYILFTYTNVNTNESHTKIIPVCIYPRTEGGKLNKFIFGSNDNTDVYLNLNCEKNSNGEYLSKVQKNEVFNLIVGDNANLNFFFRPVSSDYSVTESYVVASGASIAGKLWALDAEKDFGGFGGYQSTYVSNLSSTVNKSYIDAMVNEASNKGCTYSVGFFANGTLSGMNVTSDKMPTVSMPTIDKGANVGDTIYFEVDVTTYGFASAAAFASAELATSLEGAYFVDANKQVIGTSSNKIDIANDLNESNLSNASVLKYYVAYVVTDADAKSDIVCDVTFDYSYGNKSMFAELGTGSSSASASVKASEAEITTLTGVQATTSQKITLTDGSTVAAGEKVDIYKVYYVDLTEATLNDFAGDKSISSVKAVYDMKTGADVTSSFVKSGNGMKATASEAGVKDYLVAYAFEDGTIKTYAVRVIAVADEVAGTSLTIGGKIGLNFYVAYATQKTAIQSSVAAGYPAVGIDYSNLPTTAASATVRFSVGGEVVNEVDGTKTTISGVDYDKFKFDGIYAYQIYMPITAEVVEDGKVVSSCEYTVNEYIRNFDPTSTLGKMFVSLRDYGSLAQDYAISNGWMDAADKVTIPSNFDSSSVSINVAESTHVNGSIAKYEGATVVLEKGASASLKFLFTLNDVSDVSSVNLVIENAGVLGGDSTITVNGSEFTREGDNLYSVKIQNIAPYNWSNVFKVYIDEDGADTGVTYSVNNYFASVKSDDSAYNLSKAMFAYGEAARVWAGK
ncbi:MAG: hypothetical protein MJ166_08970 [Clostridia bacterium]|nr:hypothetical protein [Clostridia bacterium]